MSKRGTVGIKEKGFVLELPAGVDLSGRDATVAPAGRLRLRYDDVSKQLQVSIDEGDYSEIGFGGDTALTQSDFYVDPVNGSDDNLGDTAATALKTWAEYTRRIGTGVVVGSQQLHILGDLSESTYVLRGSYPQGLIVSGQLTQLATGTFDAVAGWDPTTTPVTEGRITDATKDFTTLEGRMLRVTSGAKTGLVAWVLKGDPAGAGTTVARVSAWFDPFTFVSGPPSAGDTYEVVAPTVLNGRFIDNTKHVEFSSGSVELDDLDIRSNVGAFTLSPVSGKGGALYFARCRMSQITAQRATHRIGDIQLYSCLIAGRLILYEAEALFYYNAIRDGQVVVRSGVLDFAGVNVAQRIVGGPFATFNPLDIEGGGAMVETIAGASLGACDLAAAGQACVAIRTNGTFYLGGSGSGSRLFTVDQGSGTWGVRIDANAALLWQLGTTAPAAFNFDDAVAGAEEIQLGGVTTDAATLGAAGTVNAANNAIAVVRTT